MKSVPNDAVRDVLLLSLAAGSADAAGYFGLGRVFTSNMTGNVVLLGIDIGQGHLADAARSLFVLVVFMLGVALGVRLGLPVRDSNWPGLVRRLLGPEKILLVLFAVGWPFASKQDDFLSCALLAALALAMGLQSAALNRLSAPGVGTTAITSTITALITGFVVRVADPALGSSGQRLAFQAGVLGLYFTGAAVSGLAMVSIHGLAGVLPIAAAIWVWYPHRRQKD